MIDAIHGLVLHLNLRLSISALPATSSMGVVMLTLPYSNVVREPVGYIANKDMSSHIPVQLGPLPISQPKLPYRVVVWDRKGYIVLSEKFYHLAG